MYLLKKQFYIIDIIDYKEIFMQKDLIYLINNYEYEMKHFDISNLLSNNITSSSVSSNDIIDFLDDLKGIFSDIKGLSSKTSHYFDINDFLNNLKDEKNYFYDKIIYYCHQKNIDEVDLYKKANLTRSIFSKIRSINKTTYTPSKATVLSICLALNLSLNETQEMLNIVGYSLSDKMVTDKIISWCIVHNEYNIDDINNFIYEKTNKSYFI